MLQSFQLKLNTYKWGKSTLIIVLHNKTSYSVDLSWLRKVEPTLVHLDLKKPVWTRFLCHLMAPVWKPLIPRPENLTRISVLFCCIVTLYLSCCFECSRVSISSLCHSLCSDLLVSRVHFCVSCYRKQTTWHCPMPLKDVAVTVVAQLIMMIRQATSWNTFLPRPRL